MNRRVAETAASRSRRTAGQSVCRVCGSRGTGRAACEQPRTVRTATSYWSIWSSESGCLASRSGHEPSSEQRLVIDRGNTPGPARRPGWRTRLERGLDRGRDELRGLRVDDDVPAEQHAADDLPGMRGRVVRADGGLGHTRDCRRNGPGPVAGHAGFATPFTTITGRRLARAGVPPVIVSPTVRYSQHGGHAPGESAQIAQVRTPPRPSGPVRPTRSALTCQRGSRDPPSSWAS